MPIPLDEMFDGDWYFLRAFVLGAALLVGVLLGLPFAGALCYEFLELTGSGRSVPGAVAMASVLGLSVMLLVSLTACTVPTLRALRIAPMDALRKKDSGTGRRTLGWVSGTEFATTSSRRHNSHGPQPGGGCYLSSQVRRRV